MPQIKMSLSVLMDDGRELDIVADQRDLAALEASPYNESTFLRVRHLAYTALRREKRFRGSWEEFNESECVEVVDAPDAEDGEVVDELDPGRPGRNGPG